MELWHAVLRDLDYFDAVGGDLPCNTWSRARRAPKHSRLPGPLRGETDIEVMGLPGLSDKDQSKVENANRMLFGAMKVIRRCTRKGIPGYLEHPLTSRLWKTPCMKRLLRSPNVRFVKADQCQYGAAWRKPTGLLFWCAPSAGLSRCTGNAGYCSRTRRAMCSFPVTGQILHTASSGLLQTVRPGFDRMSGVQVSHSDHGFGTRCSGALLSFSFSQGARTQYNRPSSKSCTNRCERP